MVLFFLCVAHNWQQWRDKLILRKSSHSGQSNKLLMLFPHVLQPRRQGCLHRYQEMFAFFGHVRRLAIYFGRRTDGLLNVCVSFKLISFFPILYKCSIAGLDNNTVCVVQTRLLRWEGVFTMRDKLTNCCCLTKYNTIHASCHAPIYVGLPTAANDKPRLVFWAGCLKGGIFPGKYCK